MAYKAIKYDAAVHCPINQGAWTRTRTRTSPETGAK